MEQKTKQVNISLPYPVYEKLKQMADEEWTSLTVFLKQLIIKEHGKRNEKS